MDTTTTTMTTIRPTAVRITHAFVALVIALVVAAAAAGLGGAPASALPPGTTDIVGNVGYDVPGPTGHHRLMWAPDSDEVVTAYQIERWDQTKTVKHSTYNIFGTDPEPVATLKGLPDNVVFQYRVRTQNEDGWGGWSGFEPIRVFTGLSHHRPFASENAMIQRQLDDFGVGGPIGFWPAFITDSDTAAAFFDDMATHPSRANRAKVIRLYYAYFDRAPEPAGLDYWQDQLDSGAKTLSNASSFFAKSAEFASIYGDTTDEEFVWLVYQNVLFRNPGPTEVAYWVDALAEGDTTRGKLMIGFSESPEGRQLRKGDAVVADLWATMIDETPSAGIVDAYSPFIEAGGTAGDLALSFVVLVDYDAAG